MSSTRIRRWLLAVAAGMSMGVCFGQPLRKLTLKEAEAIAAKSHPQVSAALLSALAANQVTTETRSAYFPTVFGSVTGAGALDESRIGAGALNNPVIFSRFGSGVTISQLLTDFGRTGNLTESARLHARAQDQSAQATRAQVLLQVDRSYYMALRAQSLLQVAEQTVAARQLIVDQVTALAQSKLKSGLDVSFANVNLSEAKLLLIGAQNEIKAASAELSSALGSPDLQSFELAEEPLPPALPDDARPLLEEAFRDRPDLYQRPEQLRCAPGA
ncbi:MAG: TolC family protein [Acidobacteria bacterium]|nr:TolC family protein [Acidobacteriota bacterium]